MKASIVLATVALMGLVVGSDQNGAVATKLANSIQGPPVHSDLHQLQAGKSKHGKRHATKLKKHRKKHGKKNQKR